MAHAGSDIDFRTIISFNHWKRFLFAHRVEPWEFFKKLKGGHKCIHGVWVSNEPFDFIEACRGGNFRNDEIGVLITKSNGDKICCVVTEEQYGNAFIEGRKLEVQYEQGNSSNS